MRSESLMVVFLGVIFGCVAAAMAYLISYNEYRHHFVEETKIRRNSLETALIAFAFFFGLSLILSIILPRFL